MSSAVKLYQGRFGRVALLDMDAPLVGHAHHHCHILLKAGGADSAFSVRGERAPLTDDSAVLVNAWEHHAYLHGAPAGERSVILALYIEPTWLAALQRSLALSGHPRFFTEKVIKVGSATRRLVENFVIEMWWADDLSSERMEEQLFNLIVNVIEGSVGWKDVTGMLRTRPPAAMDGRIRRALALMHEEPPRVIDVDVLARSSGLSRAHFFALFQQSTQVTPHVYSNVLRFESAVRRLSSGTDSVGDMAHDLGFSTPSHFTRFFRQHLGITPSDYRRVVNLVEPAIAP